MFALQNPALRLARTRWSYQPRLADAVLVAGDVCPIAGQLKHFGTGMGQSPGDPAP